MMRASKEFYDIARRVLYKDVLLEVHCDSRASLADLERFHRAGSRNLELVKELEIVSCGLPVGTNNPDASLAKHELWPRHCNRPAKVWKMFNEELEKIVGRVPNLKTFRYCSLEILSIVRGI